MGSEMCIRDRVGVDLHVGGDRPVVAELVLQDLDRVHDDVEEVRQVLRAEESLENEDLSLIHI